MSRWQIVLLWSALSLCVQLGSRASAQEHAAQRLSLVFGVPVPLRVYGGSAKLDGVALKLLLHLQLDYEVAAARRAPWLTLGARSALALVAVSDGELTLWGWAALVGPHLGVRVQLSEQPRTELRAGIGPALARSGFRIDAQLRRDFWAPAAFGFVAFSMLLRKAWFAMLDVGLEHVRPAPSDEAFFNQRLGATTLLALSLGVSAGF